MIKVKITVIKKLDRDIIHADSQLDCTCKGPPVCPLFHEGQEFIADMKTVPPDFCAGAYTDLFRFICGLESGANYPWMNEEGKVLVCCNDGFRPVIFKLERYIEP
ncbi:MAG: hypothetical protein A2Y12_20585 [Planctomycetes bacterium GWF2_42_9]|nr:MAG: hypothetical protein A2Y12_20585 [Planctomycetes bacterium GWF2_42_9]